MCGIMHADYHNGVDVQEWVHTFTGFYLRGGEYSEDSRMWWANGKSKSTKTRFGLVLLVPPQKADESSLNEVIKTILKYIGGVCGRQDKYLAC